VTVAAAELYAHTYTVSQKKRLNFETV